MRLVILQRGAMARNDARDQRGRVRRRGARVQRVRFRWFLSISVTAVLFAVAACSSTKTQAGPSTLSVVRTPSGMGGPSAVAELAAARPRVAPGYVLLAELARERVAALMRVDPQRLMVSFDTPEAGRMVLPRTFPLHFQHMPGEGTWTLVFDSVPGSRPELRLSLRAQLRPATEPARPRGER
jgi:hypothetical protein